MSGYLHNLACRTVDAPLLLRPRLPAHFEPNPYALANAVAAIDVLAGGGESTGGEPMLGQFETTESQIAGRSSPTSLATNNSNAASNSTGQGDSRQFEMQRGAASTSRDARVDWIREHQHDPDPNISGTDPLPLGMSEARNGDSTPRAALPRPAAALASLGALAGDPIALPSHLADHESAPSLDMGRLRETSEENDRTHRLADVQSAFPHTSINTKRPIAVVDESSSELSPNTLRPTVAMENATGRGDENVSPDRDVRFGELPWKSVNPQQFAPPSLFEPMEQESPAAVDERAPQRTVHVTIGRIEIRAVPADVRPRNPRRDRPVATSLDEYLSRHAAGNNR